MLTAEDYEILDNRYVQKDDCNVRHENVNREMADIAVQLSKTNSQLGLLIKICSATLSASGVAIIGALMKLILK